ncbi:MAG: hypothetical protein WC130_12165 [Kiritimatiellia bacterium]
MTNLWNQVPTPVFTSTGAFAAGALAYFYLDNSTTPLVVYRDAALAHPYPFPVVADNKGVFPPIYVPYVTYRRRITTATGVLISDTGDIDNPPPPGSAGIVVSADQIFQTGDPIWRLRVGTMTGWVRMNGRTLGSALSAATEYAAADAANLFAFLWNNLPDSIATVSSGRGATAVADFAANKTIVIPTMQGYLAAGVDDMGATAAGRIQAITTCNPPGGSGVIPVTSVTGIAVGQNVWINGLAAGVVNSISGLNVTISTSPALGAGVSWRSSFFSDAQQIGAAAGAANAIMTTAQMPTHSHGTTEVPHLHTYPDVGANTAQAGATSATTTLSGGTGNTSAVATGLTINNAGSGQPMGILQPTRLFTAYMKL